MADNTLQFRWIVTLQENLDVLFRHDPQVFVAGDLLWYPVQGSAHISLAPDVLVVFGRPKGYRGSYQQWREGGVAPQVVFEILSPSNRPGEMERKREFYEQHGVEEYYLYDPEGVELVGWRRQGGRLHPLPTLNGWVSPRLGIRFDLSGAELVIYRPDGERFLTFLELKDQQELAQHQAEQQRLAREQAEQQAEQQRQAREQAEHQARQERQAKQQAEQQVEQERRRAERLAERLRSLGIDPDE